MFYSHTYMTTVGVKGLIYPVRSGRNVSRKFQRHFPRDKRIVTRGKSRRVGCAAASRRQAQQSRRPSDCQGVAGP